MSENGHILEFRDVTLRSESGSEMEFVNVNLGIGRGALIVLEIESKWHGAHVSLFDMAEGILCPDEGMVKFMGKNWAEMSFGDQARMRGLIGRVFESQGWVSNLSVCENIVLSQRHHTLRHDREIKRMADRLAGDAGLSAVLEQRPEAVGRRDLQKAQWIRAFMGEPSIVLMEYPDADMTAPDVMHLIGMVEDAIRRGVAVVWMSSEENVIHDKRLDHASRYAIREGKLIPEKQ